MVDKNDLLMKEVKMRKYIAFIFCSLSGLSVLAEDLLDERVRTYPGSTSTLTSRLFHSPEIIMEYQGHFSSIPVLEVDEKLFSPEESGEVKVLGTGDSQLVTDFDGILHTDGIRDCVGLVFFAEGEHKKSGLYHVTKMDVDTSTFQTYCIPALQDFFKEETPLVHIIGSTYSRHMLTLKKALEEIDFEIKGFSVPPIYQESNDDPINSISTIKIDRDLLDPALMESVSGSLSLPDTTFRLDARTGNISVRRV